MPKIRPNGVAGFRYYKDRSWNAFAKCLSYEILFQHIWVWSRHWLSSHAHGLKDHCLQHDLQAFISLIISWQFGTEVLWIGFGGSAPHLAAGYFPYTLYIHLSTGGTLLDFLSIKYMYTYHGFSWFRLNHPVKANGLASCYVCAWQLRQYKSNRWPVFRRKSWTCQQPARASHRKRGRDTWYCSFYGVRFVWKAKRWKK